MIGRRSLHRSVGLGPLLVVASWVVAAGAAGQQPVHTSPIQITADGGFVWVANPDSDSVAKIATASNALVGEYAVGDNPRTLALSGGSLFVVNQGSQDLTAKPSPVTVMRLDQATASRSGIRPR